MTTPEGDTDKSHLFVGLYNIYFTSAETLYIFMQPRAGGSLYDWCSKRLKKGVAASGSSNSSSHHQTQQHQQQQPSSATTSLHSIAHWVKQLVEAVEVLHHRGIAHRGLKLQHVMLHNEGKDVQVTGWSGAVRYWDEDGAGRAFLLLQVLIS